MRVGIVGVSLVFDANPNSIQSIGGVLDAACQPHHIGIGNSFEELDMRFRGARDVSWTTGAALAIRAPLFHTLKGFDPIYQGGYFEDVDLCLRAAEAGYRTRHSSNVALLHTTGSSGGSEHMAANARRFHERWVQTGRAKARTGHSRGKVLGMNETWLSLPQLAEEMKRHAEQIERNLGKRPGSFEGESLTVMALTRAAHLTKELHRSTTPSSA